MRCKAHPFEYGVGVCAVCLHDRLHALIDTNKQPQQYRPSPSASTTETYQSQWRKPCQTQLPLPFPLSDSHKFSPHRRSIDGYPVVLASNRVNEDFPKKKKKKNPSFVFSTLFNRFRSGRGDDGGDVSRSGNGKETENLQFPLPDFKNSSSMPRVSEARVSDVKSSWFSNLIPGKRLRNKSIDKDGRSSLTTSSANTTRELTTTGRNNYCNPRRVECKGMSPDRYGEEEDEEEEEEEDDEVSQERRIPAPTPLRTTRRDPRMSKTKTSSGFSFCLSPLVRTSPQRKCQVGVGESGFSSGSVGSGPSRLETNRSRKLVDHGRFQ